MAEILIRWIDWWKKTFPDVNARGKKICPGYFYTENDSVDKFCSQYKSCEECRRQFMEADVAKKLGVKEEESNHG